jgi:Ni,Fe-hydrogenase I large subunit
MPRTVIDPVTRVGGHLRIEVDLAGGEVRDAWASGTMFRGIEHVMRGRDPRDAWMFAERICGTCTGVHSLASVRAVESALGITIPPAARLIRNILAATQAVRDHVVRLYLAQLPDWVDARAALRADPSVTQALAQSLSARHSEPEAFAAVRDRLAAVVDSDQPGPYGNGYWGHPAYRLSPEQDLLLLAHGLDALDWQRGFMRIHALLGGRDPHPQSYLVGGMALAPVWRGPTSPGSHPAVPTSDAPMALSHDGLAIVEQLLVGARAFVTEMLVPDTLLLANAYPDWATIGQGIGSYLAAGEYPEGDGTMFLPAGRVASRNLAVTPPVDPSVITEVISHAWYASASGTEVVIPPASGETTPAWPGLALPLTTLEGVEQYTWTKAPRYDGVPMEVGPIARMLVAFVNGHTGVRAAMDSAMTGAGLGADSLYGTLGRLVARAVEAKVLVDATAVWLRELNATFASGDLAVADLSSWDPGSWPSEAEGMSLGEGPRGTVGHWVGIRDRKVDRYQVVDGSTWNASPRDPLGLRGPIEAALVGTRVSDPAQPLELLRVVHSFDPCMACAVHAGGRSGPIEVRVRNLEAPR